MTTRKHILALAIVATALCADRAVATAHDRGEIRPRPQQAHASQGWVRRLAGTLRRVIRIMSFPGVRRVDAPKIKPVHRPIDLMLPSVRLTCSQMRLPPPAMV
jgi:hypothetical protein